MPTKICPVCRMKISWSRLDKFENIHRCLRKFEDRVITKPIIIDDIVTKMEKIESNEIDSKSGDGDVKESKTGRKKVQI